MVSQTKSRIILPYTNKNLLLAYLNRRGLNGDRHEQMKLEENHHFFPQIDLGIS